MDYSYVSTTLRQMPPDTLPIGLPINGEIHKHYKARGLSLRARRSVGKILNKEPVDFYNLTQTILDATVESLGPFSHRKDFPPKLLDTLSSIDREYICWMAVLNNYRPPYDNLLVRPIDFKCTFCGHMDIGRHDPWDMIVINVDPKSWRVEGPQIRYPFEHLGQTYMATLVTGRIEYSLSTEKGEMEDRMAKLLPQLIVADANGVPQPFSFEYLENQDFIFSDRLYRSLSLTPKPGLDMELTFTCPKCQRVQKEVSSFLPFLSCGDEAADD